jgi:long-chain acyl-CoA synthetase
VLDLTALAQFCRERLAAYKCPARINVLPELPKTASGKITRNTLKQNLQPPIMR